MYNKDKTKIIIYPIGKKYDTFEIPNGIIYIENSAFKDCENLKNIKIPNSVVKIENNAFENCENLVSIVIPSSVTELDDYAFTIL